MQQIQTLVAQLLTAAFLLVGATARGYDVPSGSVTTLPAGTVIDFLIKDGTGVLSLQGATSPSGSTVINAGALSISSASSLGPSNGMIAFGQSISTQGGQTLRFAAPMTLGQIIT